MNVEIRSYPRPILGFVAYSGTGKTTLLEKLIPVLMRRGIKIALLKHAHHDFDIDTPGKDSHRLRQAGAGQVMVASQKRWALMTENPASEGEPQLCQLLEHFNSELFDLLLVEGFKHESYPKIELQRRALAKPLMHPNDSDIIALATDNPQKGALIPQLDINSPEAIADFIQHWLAQRALDN